MKKLEEEDRQNRATSYCPASHQSLFNLQVLTRAFLEGHYVPAARVMVLSATATSESGNELLRYAIQTLHMAFSEFHRQPYVVHSVALQ